MSVTATLSGFDDLAKEMDRLGRDARPAGRAAVRSGAGKLRTKLKRAIPVGSGPTKKASGAGRKARQRGKAAPVSYIQYGRWRDNVKVQYAKPIASGDVGFRVTMSNAFWSWFYEAGSVHQPARPIVRRCWKMLGRRLSGGLNGAIGGLG
jgi:HK97 gp10 family phage protein